MGNTATTQAQKVAELFGNDGRTLQLADGRNLRAVCLEHKARVEYSNRDYVQVSPDDPEFESTGGTGIRFRYQPGSPYSHVAGDPIRYKFPDGSAIVQKGDSWGLEGKEAFSLEAPPDRTSN